MLILEQRRPNKSEINSLICLACALITVYLLLATYIVHRISVLATIHIRRLMCLNLSTSFDIIQITQWKSGTHQASLSYPLRRQTGMFAQSMRPSYSRQGRMIEILKSTQLVFNGISTAIGRCATAQFYLHLCTNDEHIVHSILQGSFCTFHLLPISPPPPPEWSYLRQWAFVTMQNQPHITKLHQWPAIALPCIVIVNAERCNAPGTGSQEWAISTLLDC